MARIESGKVSINLTEIPSDRPGYALYKTVIEDTGIGMSGEFLPHLFEEFTRERSSTESKLNAEIAITILEEAGFVVEHAEDGIERDSEIVGILLRHALCVQNIYGVFCLYMVLYVWV